MAINYGAITTLQGAAEDGPRLIKELLVYINSALKHLPSQQMGQLVFGYVHKCREFSYMLPYLRCIIDRLIETYVNKLIKTLSKQWDVCMPTLTG